jgi:Bacterial Ig-like domain/LVIVD repeat
MRGRTFAALGVSLWALVPFTSCTSSGSGSAGTGGLVGTGTGGASTASGGSPSGSGGGTSATGGSRGTATGGAAATTGGTTGGATGGGPAPGGGSGNTGGARPGGTLGGGAGAGAGGQVAQPTFSRPLGSLSNVPRPASMVNVPRASWQTDLLSPTFLDGHHIGQHSIVNGYLVIGGNEEYWIYDLQNPVAPRQLSSFNTPNRCATCGAKGEGEAESHTVSFARYGNKFYMVTTGGRGIDTWDITTPTAPVHLTQLMLTGIDYGDFTSAVWGLSWQGDYIYVGSTNNGIDIVDAHDPTAVTAVKRIPTSAYGGVSAGPLDAIGNILVVTTPKESGGIATLDISDPLNPVALDSFTADKSYIGQFYRHYVFLQSPLRVWDVLSDPSNIGSATAPLGTLTTTTSEYMSFSDDYMFLGHIRPDAGASKITVADPRNMRIVSRVWGRLNRGGINDDQFTISIGNLLVLGDDELPYAGLVIAVHATDPDTTPPAVDTVIPKNQTTGISVKSRIGVTFSDSVELATVSPASFIVRPVDGQPIPGKWGIRMGVVNFDPDQDLLPATTYEVVLPRGGVTDLVGNAIAQEFRSTFTTR